MTIDDCLLAEGAGEAPSQGANPAAPEGSGPVEEEAGAKAVTDPPKASPNSQLSIDNGQSATASGNSQSPIVNGQSESCRANPIWDPASNTRNSCYQSLFRRAAENAAARERSQRSQSARRRRGHHYPHLDYRSVEPDPDEFRQWWEEMEEDQRSGLPMVDFCVWKAGQEKISRNAGDTRDKRGEVTAGEETAAAEGASGAGDEDRISFDSILKRQIFRMYPELERGEDPERLERLLHGWDMSIQRNRWELWARLVHADEEEVDRIIPRLHSAPHHLTEWIAEMRRRRRAGQQPDQFEVWLQDKGLPLVQEETSRDEGRRGDAVRGDAEKEEETEDEKTEGGTSNVECSMPKSQGGGSAGETADAGEGPNSQ